MTIFDEARAFGFLLSEEYILEEQSGIAPSNLFQQLKSKLLISDLRKKCLPFFPQDVSNLTNTSLSGPVVLQISSVVNLSQSPTHKFDESNPRTLCIQITDGFTKATGIEMEHLPDFRARTAPGAKVLYLGGPVVRGKVLLTPENIKFLGGEVDFLKEAWQASINAQRLSKITGAESKGRVARKVPVPPPFDFPITSPEVRSSSSKPSKQPPASDKNVKAEIPKKGAEKNAVPDPADYRGDRSQQGGGRGRGRGRNQPTPEPPKKDSASATAQPEIEKGRHSGRHREQRPPTASNEAMNSVGGRGGGRAGGRHGRGADPQPPMEVDAAADDRQASKIDKSRASRLITSSLGISPTPPPPPRPEPAAHAPSVPPSEPAHGVFVKHNAPPPPPEREFHGRGRGRGRGGRGGDRVDDHDGGGGRGRRGRGRREEYSSPAAPAMNVFEAALATAKIVNSSGSSSHHPRVEWRCRQCTYHNHADLNFCEMCNTKR